MRKTSSNRNPPPWDVVAEDRPTGNNSRHDRGLREAPRTPRASSLLSAAAVCRAVTEQTVGPSWVQARRVEPACSLQVPHTPDVWTVRPRGSRGPNSRQDVQAHGREHMEHRRSRAHTARTVRIQVRFLSLFFPRSSHQMSHI